MARVQLWLMVSMALCVLVVGCDRDRDGREFNQAEFDAAVEEEVRELEERYSFEKIIEGLPDRKYEIYWLGEGFDTRGVWFEGPHVPMRGIDATDESLGFTYDAPIEDGGGGLTVLVMTAELWAKERQRIENPQVYAVGLEEVVRSTMPIAGRGAEVVDTQVIEFLDFRGMRNNVSLIQERGDTVVIISAHAVWDDARDLNPLTELRTLISVVDTLRPYPD